MVILLDLILVATVLVLPIVLPIVLVRMGVVVHGLLLLTAAHSTHTWLLLLIGEAIVATSHLHTVHASVLWLLGYVVVIRNLRLLQVLTLLHHVIVVHLSPAHLLWVLLTVRLVVHPTRVLRLRHWLVDRTVALTHLRTLVVWNEWS